MMKQLISLLFAVGTMSLAASSFAASVMLDESGEEYVWVEPYELPTGEVIEGFWRPVDQHGQLWVEPFYVDDEFVDAGWIDVPAPDEVGPVTWVPSRVAADGDIREGYWRTAEREGYVWSERGWESESPVDDVYVYETGYINERHVWVNGFYRKRVRVGYSWTEAYYLDGVYHYGYWSPAITPVGYAYVPGHVSIHGYWVDGFFRPSVYVGYSWIPGYYVGAVWHWGFWEPSYERHGHVYVHGHVHNGYWVNGYWRNSHRHGHYWKNGAYHGGMYHKGSWVKGRHPGKTKKTVYYAKKSHGGAKGAKPSVHYAKGTPAEAVRADEVGGRGRPVADRIFAGRSAAIAFGDNAAMGKARAGKGKNKKRKFRSARQGSSESSGLKRMPVRKPSAVATRTDKSFASEKGQSSGSVGKVRTRARLNRSETRVSRAQELSRANRRKARGMKFREDQSIQTDGQNSDRSQSKISTGSRSSKYNSFNTRKKSVENASRKYRQTKVERAPGNRRTAPSAGNARNLTPKTKSGVNRTRGRSETLKSTARSKTRARGSLSGKSSGSAQKSKKVRGMRTKPYSARSGGGVSGGLRKSNSSKSRATKKTTRGSKSASTVTKSAKRRSGAGVSRAMKRSPRSSGMSKPSSRRMSRSVSKPSRSSRRSSMTRGSGGGGRSKSSMRRSSRGRRR